MYHIIKNTITEKLFSSYQGFSRLTWINMLAVFINSLGTMLGVFLSLYLSVKLHFSIQQIGYIVAANGFGLMVGAYTGGALADRYHPYYTMVFSLMVSFLILSVMPFFTNFQVFLALSMISGISYGAFKPSNMICLLTDYNVKERARVNGLYRVATNLGMGFAATTGGFFAAINYHFIFWFDGLSSCLAAVLIIAFRKQFLSLNVTSQTEKLTRLSEILKNKNFIIVCLLLLAVSIIFFQIDSTYPIYLHTFYNMDSRELGYLFLLNFMIVVFLEVPILNFLKAYNQISMAAVGAALIGLGMFILPFSHSKLIAFISCILWSFGEILAISLMFAIAFNLADKAKGKNMGFFQAIFSLAMMLAPIYGSALYSKDTNMLWFSCGGIGLIALLGFYLLHQKTKDMPEVLNV